MTKIAKQIISLGFMVFSLGLTGCGDHSNINVEDGVQQAQSAPDMGTMPLICTFPMLNCDGNNATGCEANVLGDERNCGACNARCAPGRTCLDGKCIVPAPACDGLTVCGVKCVDTLNDPSNCGRCGNTCVGGKHCSAGICICPEGTIQCGLTCKWINDINSCGSCNVICSLPNGTPACVSGQCVVVSCNSGFVKSGNQCVPIQPPTCTADSQCPQGQICVSGACRQKPACVVDNDCPQGRICSGIGTCELSADLVTIKIINTTGAPMEPHLYFGRNPQGQSYDLYDHSVPYIAKVPRSQLKLWGMNVHPRVWVTTVTPNYAGGWYGCDQGAPLLGTVIVEINGVVSTQGVFKTQPQTCNNGGQGVIFFRPELF